MVGVAALTAVMLLWNYLVTPLYQPNMTREAVAGLLTRELVTLLRVRADSPALLVAVAERMLYK